MFESLELNTIWFFLVGILLTGYAILDGFDLGVGILHLFTKTDEERRLMINTIGPVWDGNEVWLVTGGGALFAAFPEVYATVFSGFYTLFIIFLFGIIFRSVSIEFRSKNKSRLWRALWDFNFAMGSFIPTFLMGVMMGNIMRGIPLNERFEFTGDLGGLFNGYAMLVGILTVFLFILHGAIYVYLKTEGELQLKARDWIENSSLFFICTYVVTNLVTILELDHVEVVLRQRPYLAVIFGVNLVIVISLTILIRMKKEFCAFIASCLSMISLMMLFGLTMYPNLVVSKPDLTHTLSIYNAASTSKTLSIMLIVAIIGVPLVLAYTVSIYWIFRGKVHLTEDSY